MAPKTLGIIHLPSTLSALRHPNFRLWFVGQSVSLIGTWMQIVAQQWIVYDLTGSKLLLGAVTFANSIPNLFLMLPSGLIADRLPRKRILLITQTMMMVLAFVMALLLAFGRLQEWHLFILAVLLGVANSLDAPARQAFTIEMIDDRKDLFNAIALNATIFNMARVIGPAVAGFILAALGPIWCFSLNGLSFLAVIAGLLLMQIKPAVQVAKADPVGQVLEGLKYTRTHPFIFPLILIAGVSSLFAFSYTSLLPAFAVDILHVGEQGLGFLTASTGLGALAGSLVVASMSRNPRQGGLLILGSLLFPAFLLLFAFSTIYPLSLILLMVVGFAFVSQSATLNTIIQFHVSDELRGRVMSIYMLAFFGISPFGALLAGALAQGWGAAAGVALPAVMSIVCTIAIFLAYPSMRQL